MKNKYKLTDSIGNVFTLETSTRYVQAIVWPGTGIPHAQWFETLEEFERIKVHATANGLPFESFPVSPLPNRQPNPYRLPLKAFLERNGIDLDAWMESDEAMDSVQPCLCTEGCEAEPDGKCPHGCPSLPLALGII